MLNTIIRRYDHLVTGLSMKHNVTIKFLLLNLGYIHHEFQIINIGQIRIFGYMKSAIKQLIKDLHLMFAFSTKMGTGRLK